MAVGIFDYIDWLTINKRKWSDLSYEERKGFNVFMVNRIFGMDPYFVETINELQDVTLYADQDMVWRLYYELLPKEKLYISYIKPKEKIKHTEKEIIAFVKYFNTRTEIATQYLDILKLKNEKAEIKKILEIFKYEK